MTFFEKYVTLYKTYFRRTTMKKNMICLILGITFFSASAATASWNDDDDEDYVAYDAQARSYRRVGNIIYRNDGTAFYQSGNMISGSDGSRWQQSGNAYYNSDDDEKCEEVSGRIICKR